ncbi:MAG: ABC transporter ATP-binding protein, partial [Betaproteobacteria bacterium]|nr:ABC transporter ATP-binding protein [Betaproteobacteria bacterium]
DAGPSAKSAATQKPAPRAAAPAKVKLSFKEQRELEQLPDELEALEREQAAIAARMSGADYHKQGAAQLKADRERAAAVEKLLTDKFERWSVLDQKTAQAESA